MYSGKMQAMIRMSDEAFLSFKALGAKCESEQLDINEVLTATLAVMCRTAGELGPSNELPLVLGE
jgi:hypothetical protein